MHPYIRIGLCVLLSLLLHMGLGWEWTLLAGMAAGLWFSVRSWLMGAAAVGCEWLLVVLYNYAVDSRAVGLMTEAMGAILGNLPGFTIVAITLAIGLLLGGLGGAIGAQVRRLVSTRRPAAHA